MKLKLKMSLMKMFEMFMMVMLFYFSKGKEISDFNNYLATSKCYDDSNRLVFVKLKDETSGVAME